MCGKSSLVSVTSMIPGTPPMNGDNNICATDVDLSRSEACEAVRPLQSRLIQFFG